jgi:NADH-quinone oxidoreductase subunit M
MLIGVAGAAHLVHVPPGAAMMSTWPILSLVTFLPLVGALLMILIVRGDDEAARRNARWIALWTTLVTFACRCPVGASTRRTRLPVRREGAWLGGGIILPHGRRRHLAAVRDPDHALMPFCILASWESRSTSRVREYMIAFLVLETLMIGVFCALDLVLFYCSSRAA